VANPTPSTAQRTRSLLLGGALLLMLLIGAAVGLYLSRISQDLRQQAAGPAYDENYECTIGDPNACGGQPENCHCLGGDACTGTECDDTIKASCEAQGRSYCTNWQGFGMTCCVPGYVCGSSDGCFPGDTLPTPTPTPTPRPTRTPTPTRIPTPTPSHTPTPTPTHTPTPTLPGGPMCYDIGMYDPNDGNPIVLSGNDDAGLAPGDTVGFTCSANIALPDGYHYQFRIWGPCGSEYHNEPLQYTTSSSNISYTIPSTGDFAVQCAVCPDGGTTAECNWESYTPTVCTQN